MRCPMCGADNLDDLVIKGKKTNEEWLRSATTEQLATFLAIVQYDGTDLTLKKNHVEKWVEWLKQPRQLTTK